MTLVIVEFFIDLKLGPFSRQSQASGFTLQILSVRRMPDGCGFFAAIPKAKSILLISKPQSKQSTLSSYPNLQLLIVAALYSPPTYLGWY